VFFPDDVRISLVKLKGRGFEDDILVAFYFFQLQLIELFLELLLSSQFTPIPDSSLQEGQ
jgi:hypothetical protein